LDKKNISANDSTAGKIQNPIAMKQTIRSLPKTRLLITCLLLFSLFFVPQSCTKINTDAPAKLAVTDAEVTQKFFTLPVNAPVAVRRAAEEMQNRNSTAEFVAAFVKKNCYPLWDKVTVAVGTGIDIRATSSAMQEGDTLIVVPVLQDSSSAVKSFINITLNGEVSLAFYRGGDYSVYSYDDVPEDSINADKAAMQIMWLNYKVFGATKFIVTDDKLFMEGAAVYTGPHPRIVKIDPPSAPVLQGRFLMVQICNQIPTIQGCSCWHHDITQCSCTIPNCCWRQSCWYIYFPPYDDSPGGSGSGGSGDPTGGGGGTSGEDFPCASSQGRTIGIANPCGGSSPAPVYPVPETVTSIINNVQNPCLNQVYNMIQAYTYKNKVASLLNDFSSTTGITIELEEGALTNAYAQTIGLSSGPNDYQITFDNTALPHCSEEFILATYFHEAIHVYLKEHLTSYDFENISSHTEMLNQYFTDLKNTIHSYFPLMSDLDLWAIMYDDIDYDPNSAPDTQLSIALKHRLLVKILQQFPATDEASLHVIAEQYREGGALGTRNPSCN
jgi:hypothetical protein